MTAAIYHAEVTHIRTERPARIFRHRTYLWLVDLDHLPRLPWWLRPFAGFAARDHLGDPRRTIRQNVDAWLTARGVSSAGGRVLMLTNARVLGHVFNPITVYWCHHEDDALACVVAEVHNTHGQRHCYLLRPDETGQATTAKRFYVSPFQRMGGEYHMRLPQPDQRLALTVALRQHDRTPLVATLRGRRTPATRRALVRAVLHRPLVTLWTSALIRRHGIAMWLRRVPITRRPPHVPQEDVR
ncbi:DUF1365 domain-containing protein [Actinophytocola sediminis]